MIPANKRTLIPLWFSVLWCRKLLLETFAYESSSSSSSSPRKPLFHVAPMQCYTNSQTRKLFDMLSPSSIKWTEMEKMDDIYPRTESIDYMLDALEKRLGPPGDHHDTTNLVLQLGTNDPERLQTCVEQTLRHYDNIGEINLNCGCPAIESGGASTYGASLMKDARLTGQLVESVRKGLERTDSLRTTKPRVSVKCRIAVFDTDKDMRPLTEGDYEALKEYASTIREHGADHTILHARPAVLSGLSPVKNRIVPTLDYGFVERIASDFEGEMDVTLNGGITTLEQLESLSRGEDGTAISGYMAGRWCLRRPLDLVGIEDSLEGRTGCDASLSLLVGAIEQYVDDAIEMLGSSSQRHKPTAADICLPLFLVVEQLRDDYDYEEDEESEVPPPLLTYAEMESLYDVLQESVAQIEGLCGSGKKKKKKKTATNSDVNFKRLSSSFKSLVGTKVANKWRRNRAEL